MTRPDTTSRTTAARRVGAAAGLIGVAVAATPTPVVEAGDIEPPPRCIDVIGNPANDASDTWDLSTWDAFFSTCEADFGFGKVIIDVVTEGGEPLPAEVDLDAITRALEFGYVDGTRDAQRLRFDPFCELEWADAFFGEEAYSDATGGYTDFRRDETISGPEKLLLEILGDRDPLDGPGATDYEIDANEVLLTHYCTIADTDQLRETPIADVGGGYQLVGGVNASYANGDFDFLGPNATIQVIVSPIPTPTTTTTTTTTVAPTTTTTTVAPTTTTTVAPTTATTTTAVPTTVTTTTTPPAVAAPSPTVAPAVAPILPATGSRNAVMSLLAVALLALGGITTMMSRRRPTD